MKIGDKVEHILSGEWLLVLEINGDGLICRRKNLESVILYSFEVKLI